jgi:hypothetical protein
MLVIGFGFEPEISPRRVSRPGEPQIPWRCLRKSRCSKRKCAKRWLETLQSSSSTGWVDRPLRVDRPLMREEVVRNFAKQQLDRLG